MTTTRHLWFLAATFRSAPICCCCFILILVCSATTIAQYALDLEVKLESQPEVVRGGEKIIYKYSIRNNGPSTAVSAVLLGGYEDTLMYDSATASKGKCTIDQRDPWVLRCLLGDLLPNETVTIEVSAKVNNIDDLSKGNGNGSGNGELNGNIQQTETTYMLSRVHVSSSIKDTNEDNDFVDLKVRLLPSPNKPPRVKIVSPKDESKLVKPAGRSINSVITIEADDPDGKVAAVKVLEPRHNIRPVGVNAKGYIFEYEGVQYSAAELEEYLKRNPPVERLATPTGKNTYSYTVSDLQYGRSQVIVTAVDDGGRESIDVLRLEVKADSTIEIVSPKPNQIIPPETPLVVETISTLKQGRLQDVTISGDGIPYLTEPTKMELVSKQGNMYRHRYQIGEVPFNGLFSNLHVTLTEEAGGYSDAEVGFLVRDLPKMSFMSFADGDTLEKTEMEEDPTAKIINVRVEIENRSYDDDYELFIDGKYFNTFSSESLRWLNPATGKHTLQIVASFGKSKKIELARSRMITITVK